MKTEYLKKNTYNRRYNIAEYCAMKTEYLKNNHKNQVIILNPDGYELFKVDEKTAARVKSIAQYRYFEYDPAFSGLIDETLPLRERFKGLISMLFGYKFKPKV